MFDRDSRSVVRSLIGLSAFRSNPVSKVYQHRSRNDGILEVTWSSGSLREKTVKDTAVGQLIDFELKRVLLPPREFCRHILS